jgi:hypothetical protein
MDSLRPWLWGLTGKWRGHQSGQETGTGEGENSGDCRAAAGFLVFFQWRFSGNTLEGVGDGMFSPVVGGKVDNSDSGYAS